MPHIYHIKIELYPTPGLSATGQLRDDPAWLPPTGFSVFDDLPARAYSSQSIAGDWSKLEDRPEACSETRTLPIRHPVSNISERRSPQVVTGASDERPEGFSGQQCRGEIGDISSFKPRHSYELQKAAEDWRFGQVSIESIDPTPFKDMPGEDGQSGPSAAPTLGPSYGGAGTATRADCVPFVNASTEVGWGVVRFYREGGEPSFRKANDGAAEAGSAESMDDCTTLCIPAVPGYMSPSEFLGFVGDRWRDELSHCRLVMTSKVNCYLALLRFREGQVAKKWKREFDGRVFNSMEPKLCHVVFVKSITFETPTRTHGAEQVQPPALASSSSRPLPPPPPNLVELPTCPVCLERMDDTNGLVTIPCSHVFHCTCLQSWEGVGCPVCRFTNTLGAEASPADATNPYSQPFGSSISNLCSVCDCTDGLWVCLICGKVGCGRYRGGHAKDHWKETAHSFALELETQHVWDYAGDMWVHRLIRDKGDGKVVELPGRGTQGQEEDVVPRAKLDNMSLEYAQLITSQLESQRAYYDEMVNKAVDKAAQASAWAESSAKQSAAALKKVGGLEAKMTALSESNATLERDLERERDKATKSQALARNLAKSLQDEKRITDGLLERIEHMRQEHEALERRFGETEAKLLEASDLNHDLRMYISSRDRLTQMEQSGEVAQRELQGSSASVPEQGSRRRRRR